ncbi:MAG: hypothetical protein KatS3mg025_0207 [Bacteroidia bacterium]|nr:MAG: hypothetical protein KatS3mg025_0207 [Bacteroidia bacterium]
MYRDPYLVAILKPAGTPSLPERQGASGKEALSEIRRIIHPEAHLLHRLDKPTSGILVASWDKEVFRALYEQFAAHRVEKKYWALVHGEPDFEAAELTAPIAPTSPPRVDPYHGKPALTFAQTVERFRGYSLVVCVPVTGRLHQVRLHLAYYGFPIVGDTAYGGKPLFLSDFHPRYKAPAEGERPLHSQEVIFLHAGYLAFQHPVYQKKLTLEAAFPRHFNIALRQLRKWAARRSPSDHK